MLIDQLSYLNGFTSQGDHRPGNDAYDRLAQLQSELSQIETQLNALENWTGTLTEASE